MQSDSVPLTTEGGPPPSPLWSTQHVGSMLLCELWPCAQERWALEAHPGARGG